MNFDALHREPRSSPPVSTEPYDTRSIVTRNLITDYYDRLPDIVAASVPDPAPQPDPVSFSPGFDLPVLDADMRQFFDSATAQWQRLDGYSGVSLSLLDLTGNPHTQTTKTAASLLIVARAVEYIRRTGEPILIFSPTSANKGTALRDAVDRALRAGLVTARQLRVAVLAPDRCRGKLRHSRLAADPDLLRRNPVLTYAGPNPEDVKALGRQFVRAHAAELKAQCGINVWFSLELANYLIADAARAFVEHDLAPAAQSRRRVHVHAVSSAFGLLGYCRGRDVLEAAGLARESDRPGFLLVQHLGTPGMVLNLCFGDFDRRWLPEYQREHTGLFTQDVDPRFPRTTYDPHEILDQTFYTREPATSPSMNALIERHGGGGIVVSLHECLGRYARLAALLDEGSRPLPRDPRSLREWSLVMALTGAMNAVDRGLLSGAAELVVHGSGSYAADDYVPLADSSVTPVRSVPEIAAAVKANC